MGPVLNRKRIRASLISIGVLLALLVPCSLTAVSAAAENACTPPTSFRPMARTAVVEPFGATWIAEKLLGGLLSKVGGEAFGGVLASFGLGDQAANAKILKELEQIQNRLSAIESATHQLRGELAQSSFSGLVSQTTPIIGAVNQGMADLRFIAGLRPNDPTKKTFSERTLDFIGRDLLYKQQELCLRISGEAGSDGLIKAASKAAKANTRYWTIRTSQAVRDVFDYYQEAEARLLVLRVEYMRAHPEAYNTDYIRAQIDWLEKILKNQHALLKPSPGDEVIADTTTNLDWWWTTTFINVPYSLFDEIFPTDLVKNAQGQLELRPRYEYRLPFHSELEHFLDKRPAKANWAEWLRDKQNVPFPDPLPYGWMGVFAYSPQPVLGPSAQLILTPHGSWHLAPTYGLGAQVLYGGAFGVRTRDREYWW